MLSCVESEPQDRLTARWISARTHSFTHQIFSSVPGTRWQEYTEELYKKDRHDPHNYDGVIILIEPDSSSWSMKSIGPLFITTNKASGDDGIPVETFQILKDDAVKLLHSICQQIWKTQQWPQDCKMSVFIPIPKKGNAKECPNYCTTALTSHTSKVMLKIFQARLQ